MGAGTGGELFPRAALWKWDTEEFAKLEKQFEAQGLYAVSDERRAPDKKGRNAVRDGLRSRHLLLMRQAKAEEVAAKEAKQREEDAMNAMKVGQPVFTLPKLARKKVNEELVPGVSGEDVKLSSKYIEERMKDPVFKAFFDSCMQHKLLPESEMQFKHSNSGCLDLSFYGMGDQYLVSIAEAFKIVQNEELKTLCLRACRVSNTGIKHLLAALQKSRLAISSLDISCNDITFAGITDLGQFLQQPSCCLAELNLDNNALGDRAIIALCGYLCNGSTLHKLCLNENNIGGKGTLAIAKLLSSESNCRIKALELAWNQITGMPAKMLIQSLHNNHCLESLILDWNNLSGIQDFSDEFGAFLSSESALRRLSMRHNGLQEAATRETLETLFVCEDDQESVSDTSLKVCTALLSLDLTGNVVPKEFCRAPVMKTEEKLEEIWPENRSLEQTLVYSRYGSAKEDRDEVSDSAIWKLRGECWIANNWEEQTIWYYPGISGPPADSLELHCSLPNGVKYSAKMVPIPELQALPDKKHSTNSFTGTSSHLLDFSYNRSEPKPENFALHDRDKPFHPFKLSLLLPPGLTTVEFFIDEKRHCALDLPTLRKARLGKRKRRLMNYVEVKDAPKTPAKHVSRGWTVEDSLFGRQAAFNRGRLAECFESDWEALQSKNYLMKDLMATNEYSVIRVLLWTHYLDIITAFNYRASLADNIFAMDILELRRWFDEAQVIPENFNDEIFEKIYDQAAFYQNRVAKDLVGRHYQYFVITRGTKRARRKGGLCRHQFLQFVLSYTFEMLTSVRRRPFLGLRMLLSKLLDKGKVHHSHRETFRKEYLLHEDVCTTLEESLPVLQRIFDKYAVRGHVRKSFFTLATWNKIVLLLNKAYGTLPLTHMFVMSKDTLIPVQHEDFTPGLDFLEFIECLTRLAQADITAQTVIGAMKDKSNRLEGTSLAQQVLHLATELDQISKHRV